ncbi:MAG: hypothetical protein JNL45_11870 [Hyphomicrobium sp.]|nr:hypothetical protein [Hyphomicrobium sp.]
MAAALPHRLGGAQLQGASATEASGLAGLARDGINGGNDWGRLSGVSEAHQI